MNTFLNFSAYSSELIFIIDLGVLIVGIFLFFFAGYHFLKLREKNIFLEQERNSLLDKLDMIQEEQERNKKREEESEKNREQKFLEKIEKLENAREKLEQEQFRVQKQDEEIQKKREENFARIWNDHENMVLAELKKVTNRRECRFVLFENTNLPDEFSGNLKPDAMISFLNQYIIFDAKKSKNPKQYIESQVKISAQKYKNSENSDRIYNTVFFVLPDEELNMLEKTCFYEDEYTFFVISVSSIFPLLMLFQKISEYENLENFDPREREALVNILAEYDRHISFQNATNMVLAKKSLELINTKKSLPESFQEAIESRKLGKKEIRLNPSEVKKYIKNPTLLTPLHSSS